jgi:hypothetical protein
LNSQNGGSSGFNNASLRHINMNLFNATTVESGDTLTLRVSVRIACAVSGHASGTARLWYDDAQANSRVAATIDRTGHTYYLHPLGQLSETVGAGPKKTIDVTVNNKQKCPARAYTTIGSFAIVLGSLEA